MLHFLYIFGIAMLFSFFCMLLMGALLHRKLKVIEKTIHDLLYLNPEKTLNEIWDKMNAPYKTALFFSAILAMPCMVLLMGISELKDSLFNTHD